jgi:hypothetical protein
MLSWAYRYSRRHVDLGIQIQLQVGLTRFCLAPNSNCPTWQWHIADLLYRCRTQTAYRIQSSTSSV